MASKLKAAAGSFERHLLPRLNSIDGELKAIHTRIDAVNGRIDGVEKSIDSTKAELRAEIKAADVKIDRRCTSQG
jgi:DNA-binding FrmR family transcriptional regulator